MRAFVVCAVVVMGTAVSAGVLAAQDTTSKEAPGRTWKFELFPRLGFHAADKALGETATDGPAFGISGSMTMGMSAQMTTPVRWLDLRLVYDRTVGADLVERVFVGDPPCGFSCFHSMDAGLRTGYSTTVETGAIDAVIRPWRNGTVAPYAFGGVGFEHYALGNGTTGPSTAYGYHFGLGLDISFGPLELQLEAGNTMTGGWPHNFPFLPGGSFDLPLNPRALLGSRHDLVTSVGLKFRR